MGAVLFASFVALAWSEFGKPPTTRPTKFALTRLDCHSLCRHFRAAAVGSLVISFATTTTAAAGLIRDAETEGLIRTYAKPIFNAAGLGSQGIDIHIVNDRAFNAFVVDGHNMFINAGALILSRTPNQIIGVIAHESGHITGGHLARLRNQIAKAKSASLMLQALALAAMVAGAAGGSNIGLIRPGAAYGGTDTAMRMVLAYRRDEESSADQAAITFLNATKQSARGLLETLQFMSSKLVGVQGLNPFLQTHPFPQQRMAQLRSLAEASPYYEVKDPPELQFRHNLVKAKLYGFLNQPQTVFNRYPQSNQTLAAKYARAIATYRKSGVKDAIPELDALIAAKPDWPYFHEIKGRFLFESGNVTAAIPCLRQAAMLGPDEPLIRIALAQALLETQNPEGVDEALADLRTALARETSSAMGYRQLAVAFARKGDAAKGAARQSFLAQADLASAEAYFYEGQLKPAQELARRAKAGFLEGTPNWLRADDILTFENLLSKRR
jgi:predicted Zn-dependent protease